MAELVMNQSPPRNCMGFYIISGGVEHHIQPVNLYGCNYYVLTINSTISVTRRIKVQEGRISFKSIEAQDLVLEVMSAAAIGSRPSDL